MTTMMLSQIQDALLLLLLPLVGGFVGGAAVFLLTARRPAGRRRAEPAAPVAVTRFERRGPARLAADALVSRWTSRPQAAPALPRAADLLLVDDSAVARAKLRRLFEQAGYTVHLACDGLEALALLDKGSYAMMITDLEMPNMDGQTLINTCLDRPRTAHMPILAISGHEGLRARFNECRDIAGVHRKPWVDDILLSRVATLVSARRERVAVPA
jgi:CheY-like chemotaxis protein